MIQRPRVCCPIPDCDNQMDPSHIMCATHWYRVPKADRDRIWRLYKTQRGSVAHRRAVMNAILHVQRELRACS